MLETAMATKSEGQVARPLRVLVPLIKEDLENGRAAAERAGMPYYQAAGEKLTEAKSQMTVAEFTPWAQRNFGISQRQAYRYMQLAAHIDSLPRAAKIPTTIREFERETGRISPADTGKVSWHGPIKQIVNRVDTETLNLKREELKRHDEREAQRKLALQLIDIGYKVLARTLHPDKGGSREAMSRLNAVRDRLKQYA